jgi:protein-S-isoprenylcysteine O-methyltransferase Ste14
MRTRVPPPVFLLTTGALMWFVAHSAFAASFAFPYSIILAIPLAAVGIAIDVVSLRQFRAVETTISPLKPENATSLVRDGMFSVSRNPMYLGMLFILLGWGVWLGSASNVALLLLFVLTMNFLQIKPEEAVLRSLFGQEYENYCEEVRRWI